MFNIDPNKCYRRIATKDVFTGQQVLNLMKLSGVEMQAVILLSIVPTDEPATDPKSTYGPAEQGVH